ncbi:hypothetical protein QYF61_023072 [Mycteria americana]|uniref:Uncharacterized protein n=1 Tax=Mycteria americana TaxID=33587 RepID=A0AAN7PF26_MYCAM|nr:hypothetical protein QYF61_023072 [Mycteria americana]
MILKVFSNLNDSVILPPRPLTNMNDTMVTHMSSGAPTPTKRLLCDQSQGRAWLRATAPPYRPPRKEVRHICIQKIRYHPWKRG